MKLTDLIGKPVLVEFHNQWWHQDAIENGFGIVRLAHNGKEFSWRTTYTPFSINSEIMDRDDFESVINYLRKHKENKIYIVPYSSQGPYLDITVDVEDESDEGACDIHEILSPLNSPDLETLIGLGFDIQEVDFESVNYNSL